MILLVAARTKASKVTPKAKNRVEIESSTLF